MQGHAACVWEEQPALDLDVPGSLAPARTLDPVGQVTGFGTFQGVAYESEVPPRPPARPLALKINPWSLCVPRIPSMALTSRVALPAVRP
jgi:hypothetical protein